MSLGSDKGIAQAAENVSPERNPDSEVKEQLSVKKKKSAKGMKSPKKIGKIGSPKMGALIGNGEIPKKTKSNLKSTSNLKIPSKIEINLPVN